MEFYDFAFSWECHHPNCYSLHHFSEGWRATINQKSDTWQCVKTLYPCSSHQNSWDLWMFIPLKMVLIGIDIYIYIEIYNPII